MLFNKGFYLYALFIFMSGCGVDYSSKRIGADDFFNELKKLNLSCDLLPFESDADLSNLVLGSSPIGLYKGKDFTFSL